MSEVGRSTTRRPTQIDNHDARVVLIHVCVEVVVGQQTLHSRLDMRHMVTGVDPLADNELELRVVLLLCLLHGLLDLA